MAHKRRKKVHIMVMTLGRYSNWLRYSWTGQRGEYCSGSGRGWIQYTVMSTETHRCVNVTKSRAECFSVSGKQ